MIDKQEEYVKMASVEENLWWYRILHENVFGILKKYKVNSGELIVDAGCGTGGLMSKLVKMGYKAEGIDVSEYAVDFCKKKA